MKNNVFMVTVILSLAVSACLANTAKSCCAPAKKIETVDSRKSLADYSLEDILSRLRYNNSQLKSFKCKVRYLVTQNPKLLASETLRNGYLYYKKDDSGSKIRINFDTEKQDDEAQQDRKLQFIFDGVWLTKIDYSMKNVDHHQQAEKTKPLDVFEYFGNNFPIVGFSETENLHEQFEIEIIDKPAKPGKPIRLHLKVRKDSVYKDDYVDIEFWIDSKTFLPARIISRSAGDEEDIYDVQLINAEINKNLKNSVFKLETPKDFSENRYPLKKESESEK